MPLPPHVQSITIVGGARSGQAALRLLADTEAALFLSEYGAGDAELRALLQQHDVAHELGGHTERALNADLMVLSPGVPSTAPVVQQAQAQGIRVVSEIMGSNGSSSMASACVGTLSLMDAGVPIKAPVAGISVGLFTDDTRSQLVLDILGSEDHCGDMDFKVCGTRKGITSFQVDLKIPGLTWEQVEGAFELANKGRQQILDYMESVIASPREELSAYAPRLESIKIDPEKIGALIGPGGKNIRRVVEVTGAEIDIDDDDSGRVNVFATTGEAMKRALEEIDLITAEIEVGKTYRGVVRGVKDFGAFVECLPGKEGLVHIAELAEVRGKKTEDICRLGDEILVKCIGIDDKGRVKLSRKQAMEDSMEKGQDSEEDSDQSK